MAIKTSGQIVHLREILLRQKPQEFLTDSQKGTVPVLKLENGSVIDESLDVMHWALNINDPMNLKGVLDEEPVYSKSFLKTLDHDFKNSLDRYKYSNRYQGGGDQKLHHRDVGEKFLESIEKRLTSNAFISGDSFGFLDVAGGPFIRQFRIADPNWFDTRPWKRVHAWLHEFLESQLFLSVMTKYKPWNIHENNFVIF